MNQKSIIAILGVVVIILIGTTVYFATLNKSSEPITPPPKVVQQSSPAPAVQQPAQQTTPQSDNLAYKNDKYGFEFQQPKNWEVDSSRTNANAVVFVDKKNGAGESREAINFETNIKNLSLDQVVNNFIKERGYAEQQVKRDYVVKVGGEKTAQIETGEFGLTIYIFVHKGTIFTIETQSLFTDDVLKTFKFTN